MPELFIPGKNQSNDPTVEQIIQMNYRISMLSEQVNYLLRCLYMQNPGHAVFQHNPQLAADVKKAIDLEKQNQREERIMVATPDFTREKLTELKAKGESQS